MESVCYAKAEDAFGICIPGRRRSDKRRGCTNNIEQFVGGGPRGVVIFKAPKSPSKMQVCKRRPLFAAGKGCHYSSASESHRRFSCGEHAKSIGFTRGLHDSGGQALGARVKCRGPPRYTELHSTAPIAMASICSLFRGFAATAVSAHLTKFANCFLNYFSFKLYITMCIDHGKHPSSSKTLILPPLQQFRVCVGQIL